MKRDEGVSSSHGDKCDRCVRWDGWMDDDVDDDYYQSLDEI